MPPKAPPTWTCAQFWSFHVGCISEDVKNTLNSFGGDQFCAGSGAVQQGRDGGASQSAVDVQHHDVPAHRLSVLAVGKLFRSRCRGWGEKDGECQENTAQEEKDALHLSRPGLDFKGVDESGMRGWEKLFRRVVFTRVSLCVPPSF